VQQLKIFEEKFYMKLAVISIIFLLLNEFL